MDKAKILVVEDEGIIARDTQRLLKKLGYDVPATAASGPEAIQKAAEIQPDLVLMDIVLRGEMDGIEAAERIRSRLDTPVIFVTAFADPGTLERAKVTEPFGYILKPFTEQALMTNVEMALYKHRMDKRLRESETFYRYLIEKQGEGILVVDLDEQITFCNPVAAGIFGVGLGELIGKNLSDFTMPEAFEFLQEQTRRRQTGERGTYHLDILRPGGEQRHLLVTVAPWVDGEGNVVAAFGVVRDDTERIRAEQALQERERFLTLLNEITEAALETPDLSSMLHALADRLQGLFGADGCYITRWDAATGSVIPEAASGQLHEAYHQRGPSTLQPTMTASVLQAGSVLPVEDVFNTPYLHPDIAARYPARSVLALPLLADNRKAGAALIAFNTPHTFSPDEIARGEQVARHIALAVSKAQLLEKEREQRIRAEALTEAALALTSQTNFKAVMGEILRQVQRIVPFTTANIALLEGNSLHTVHWHGYVHQAPEWEKTIPDLVQPLSDWSVDARVVQSRAPIVIADTHREPDWVDTEVTRWIRAYLAAPICLRDRVLGLLRLDSDKSGHFGPQDAERLQPLTNAAAIAIENARLLAETRQRADELETLRCTSLQINALLDLDTVLETIAQSALSLVGATDTHIYLYDAHTQTFSFGTALWQDGRKEPAVASPRRDGFTALVARQGETIVFNQAFQHPLFSTPEAEPWKMQAIAGFPLKRAERVVGVFTVAFLQPHTFTEDELRVLELLADQAVVAIENARLVQDLEAEVQARVAEIVAEQEKSAVILRNVGDAIAVTDLERRVQYVNDAFLTLTGYPAAEVLGQSVEMIYGLPSPEPERRSLQRAIEHGQVWQGEVAVQRHDGRVYDAAFTVAPVHSADGQLVNLVFSHRDVSRIRELERARSRFLTNVSHQFRTPVTNLKLYTHLLRNPSAPGRAERYLDALKMQVEQLSRLVQDVLELTTLDSGQAITEWVILSVSSLVQDCIERYRGRAEQSGVALTALPVPAWLPSVSGDAGMLGRALDELVENAITFSPVDGRVTLRADTATVGDQDWVTLAVQDAGPGISPEEQERVFDRFFRGNLAESGHVPGTGLGLSIVYEIMRAHGGQVTVESTPGQGSVFTLWLRY